MGKQRLMILLPLAALSACAMVEGGPPRTMKILSQDQKRAHDRKPADGDPATRDQYWDIRDSIETDCLRFKQPAADRLSRRNDLALAYMLVTDRAYNDFEMAMMQQGQVGSFVATITSFGLATAGSIAKGKTARVLTAANAGVIGEREAFTKEFLFSLTVPALQNQMRASRATIRTRIYERMKLGLGEWPTCIALQDLAAYEQAGTIVGALVGINATTAVVKNVAETQAQDAVERFPYDKGPIAAALRDYLLVEDPTLFQTRLARLTGPARIAAALTVPDKMAEEEYIGRLLGDPTYATSRRAMLLGLLQIETDAAARKPLVEALSKKEE